MAGYSAKPLAQKLGLKANMRIHSIRMPVGQIYFAQLLK